MTFSSLVDFIFLSACELSNLLLWHDNTNTYYRVTSFQEAVNLAMWLCENIDTDAIVHVEKCFTQGHRFVLKNGGNIRT